MALFPVFLSPVPASYISVGRGAHDPAVQARQRAREQEELRCREEEVLNRVTSEVLQVIRDEGFQGGVVIRKQSYEIKYCNGNRVFLGGEILFFCVSVMYVVAEWFSEKIEGNDSQRYNTFGPNLITEKQVVTVALTYIYI